MAVLVVAELEPLLFPLKSEIIVGAAVNAAVTNAKAFLKLQEEFGSFDAYLWKFVDGTPIDHRLERVEDMPAENDLSRLVSRDLKKRGFSFVGPTIAYSYLQGIGVFNDHVIDCDYR